MSNLLKNGLHLERVDVFKLGGYKHAGDVDAMKVVHLLLFGLVLEVSVHKVDCQEKGLVITFEVGEYFDHPVYHSSSQRSSDSMVD